MIDRTSGPHFTGHVVRDHRAAVEMRALRNRALEALERRQAADDADPHDDAGDQYQQHLRHQHVQQYLARESVALALGFRDPHDGGRPSGCGVGSNLELHYPHRRALHGAVVERFGRVARDAFAKRGFDRVTRHHAAVGAPHLEVDAVDRHR